MTTAGIEYELTRKRVKNINLRIHPPDGRVTVSAPRRTSEAFIAAFVAAKAPWIRKQQARIAAMPCPVRSSLTPTGKNMRFWGIRIRWKSTQRRAIQALSFNLRCNPKARRNHPRNRASWCTPATRAMQRKSSATSTGRTAENCSSAWTCWCRSGSNASAFKPPKFAFAP